MTISTDSDANDNPPTINSHETTPERIVFTETGNTDGWIATDLTLPITP